MTNKNLKTIPEQVRDNILADVKKSLRNYEEIDRIFIEQKNKNVFEVLVITKKINPIIEREVVKVEDEVKERYKVPVNLSTLSGACIPATI